jgi:hypothetical protein
MFPKKIISYSEFQQRKEYHTTKVSDLLADYLSNKNLGKKQPVLDFLFEYYFFKPSLLQRYSPGIEIGINAEIIDPLDKSLFELNHFIEENGIWFLSKNSIPENRITSIHWVIELLIQTNKNEAQFGCLGLHEWAMVYKEENDLRHSLPLRLDNTEIRTLVESKPLKCTHFDAFRFFTEHSRPLNKVQLNKDNRLQMEQSGCIHTTMDIYRWAHKFYPWIASERITEAFELAVEARTIDMQASPYDVSLIGLTPIKIESKSGAEEYISKQKQLNEKGKKLRALLIQDLTKLI